MKSVMHSEPMGCTFLGKGLVGHPEMGVIVECRKVILDEWDVMHGHWKNRAEERVMYRTDNGYCFDDEQLHELYEVELYAPNWRARKPDAWGNERN